MTAPVPPPGTLVFLHGHDDDPVAAAEAARSIAGPAWTVVAPSGPVATAAGRRAWWGSDDDGAPIAADVDAAVAIVVAVLDQHAATTPIVLGGFSQGGALALALAVAAPPDDRPAVRETIAGAFAIGAWLPDLVAVPADLAGVADRHLPVLVAHGADDDAVDLLLGRSAARLLDRHGVPVSYVQLDAGHRIDPFVPAVAAWVAAIARGETPVAPP